MHRQIFLFLHWQIYCSADVPLVIQDITRIFVDTLFWLRAAWAVAIVLFCPHLHLRTVNITFILTSQIPPPRVTVHRRSFSAKFWVFDSTFLDNSYPVILCNEPCSGPSNRRVRIIPQAMNKCLICLDSIMHSTAYLNICGCRLGIGLEYSVLYRPQRHRAWHRNCTQLMRGIDLTIMLNFILWQSSWRYLFHRLLTQMREIAVINSININAVFSPPFAGITVWQANPCNGCL